MCPTLLTGLNFTYWAQLCSLFSTLPTLLGFAHVAQLFILYFVVLACAAIFVVWRGSSNARCGKKISLSLWVLVRGSTVTVHGLVTRVRGLLMGFARGFGKQSSLFFWGQNSWFWWQSVRQGGTKSDERGKMSGGKFRGCTARDRKVKCGKVGRKVRGGRVRGDKMSVHKMRGCKVKYSFFIPPSLPYTQNTYTHMVCCCFVSVFSFHNFDYSSTLRRIHRLRADTIILIYF